MKYLRKHIPEIIILVYAIIFSLTKNPSNEWDRVIASDGKGYYGYLTALFIYHDTDYGFIDQYESEYYPAGKQLYKDFRFDTGNGIVNKYFPGLSILWIPFFAAAHAVALVFDYPADGYSLPYQWSIAISALFYFWLSLLILRRILRFYTKNENSVSCVLVATALATNLIYYTVNAGCQVHVYNFFLINAFLYSILVAVNRTKPIYIATAAFFLGMIIITRPQNVLIVFSLPFICGNRESFFQLLKNTFSRIRFFIPACIAIAIPLLVPVIYWYAKTGNLIVYSYGNETYDLTKPHLLSFLFSFEKGWLLYTPVAAFALLGFIFLAKKSKWQFFSLSAFLFFIVYFLSSWWVWNYTSYISQRVMIDYYAFVAILLIFIFNWVEKNSKKVFLKIILTGFIAINIMQYFQQLNWIYPAGPVTAKSYFSNFFHFSRGTTFMIPENEVLKKDSFFTDFETESPFFITAGTAFSTKGYTGKKSLEIEPNTQNKILFIRNISNYKDIGPVIIRFGAWLSPQFTDSSFTLTASIGTNNAKYSITQHNLMTGLKPNKWRYSEMVAYLPYIRSVSDSLFISISNHSSGKILMDDMRAEFLKMLGSQRHDWILAPDDQIQSSKLFYTNLETKADSLFGNMSTIYANKAFSGKNSSRISAESQYSIVFENDLEFFNKSDGYVRVSSQISGEKQSEVLLVFDFSKEGKTVFYKTYPVTLSTDSIWRVNEIFRELPANSYKAQRIKIYYWYVKGKNPVYIDDMHVDFVKYKTAEIPFRTKSNFNSDPLISGLLCNDFETIEPAGGGMVIETSHASSGKHACVINQKQPYSSSFLLTLEKIQNKQDAYIYVNAKVNTDQYTSGVSLVVDFKQNGKSFSYHPAYLRSRTIKGQWCNIDFGVKIPEGITSKDSVLVYFYHPNGDEECLIDDFCISLRTSKTNSTKMR